LLHIEHGEVADSDMKVTPKLVEINTIAPDFMGITENIAKIHK